jgi:hypothetical protein
MVSRADRSTLKQNIVKKAHIIYIFQERARKHAFFFYRKRERHYIVHNKSLQAQGLTLDALAYYSQKTHSIPPLGLNHNGIENTSHQLNYPLKILLLISLLPFRSIQIARKIRRRSAQIFGANCLGHPLGIFRHHSCRDSLAEGVRFGCPSPRRI